jgi:hypothetical protein
MTKSNKPIHILKVIKIRNHKIRNDLKIHRNLDTTSNKIKIKFKQNHIKTSNRNINNKFKNNPTA